MNAKDYKNTLNLPKTNFPMKASLIQKEPLQLAKWDKMHIYEKIKESRRGAKPFFLHDGPPYANGKIHMGTALNKILKDFVTKSWTMLGYYSPFVPGWDCHGLPIELQVDRMLAEQKAKKSPYEFRQECRKYAEKYLNIQREGFKRLGVIGRWDTPYLTMNPLYQAAIARTFGAFAKKGLVYQDVKPIYWCCSCKTALAEAEIEYKEHSSPSIHVKFQTDQSWSDKLTPEEIKNTSVIIWTTTPWTLPANLAIALHPEAFYVLLKSGNENFIIAENLIDKFQQETHLKEAVIIKKYKGKELEGLTTDHPFIERKSIIVLADYVSMDQGTGCVHTAPGHGQEDYLTGIHYGLKPFSPLDDDGKFTEEIPKYKGLQVFDANSIIVVDMKKTHKLLYDSELAHSYPHCWRCKNPVIFRATKQWFISLDKTGLRKKSLDQIKEIAWIPEWGEERIYQMVETRPDWCISRQRIWGVPITQFGCVACGEVLKDERIYDRIADIYEKESADAWYVKTEKELLPENCQCTCGSTEFKKGMDILDVWFDSGASHEAVMTQDPDLHWPSDIYLEGNDQYRGWFNSSLLIGVHLYEKSPYRICVTHGMVVDEKGYKMSKTLGNFIDPEEIIEKYGAEILRAWVAMVDYKEEVRVSFALIEKIAESYRKLRNTCRFMLGNLYDFDPTNDNVHFEHLTELDKWALMQIKLLEDKIYKAYQNYEFHIIYHAVQNFSIVDMSSFYLNILKDRLYVLKNDSLGRRSAQTVIYHLLNSLIRLIAPIYSFTADEVWEHMPHYEQKEESVHLTEFLHTNVSFIDQDFIRRWELFLEIREIVLKELETKREQNIIHDSLEARLNLFVPSNKYDIVNKYKDLLKEIFIVSQLQIEKTDGQMKAMVEKASGNKCLRCWNYDDSVGTLSENKDVCARCNSIL
ncbi:MAG: isoleucine--tRNA ligase [Candidatus Fischerbacteria bacterium RBG_13_37_8]|uniref:Isoleucine--tRNA ligase n=1 Tax=Candidatus Fischerbacteria bacterium RBG_13_37_8 TaxID=1817863 RepID=A0A1F5VQ81_9BACT|nr:MAG: isoleucine--tRNA ligase [Candidatus Fischerbacteria bacterium RBG_13_37_8]